jgi:hypothetical protein
MEVRDKKRRITLGFRSRLMKRKLRDTGDRDELPETFAMGVKYSGPTPASGFGTTAQVGDPGLANKKSRE